MAPRSSWKGYLKLSLLSCPIALYTALSAAEHMHDLGALGPSIPDRPEQNPVTGLGSRRTSDTPERPGVIPHDPGMARTRGPGSGAPRASRSRFAGAVVDALHEAVGAREPVAARDPLELALAQERQEKGAQGSRLRAATTELPKERLLAACGAGVAPEHLKNRFACESHAPPVYATCTTKACIGDTPLFARTNRPKVLRLPILSRGRVI